MANDKDKIRLVFGISKLNGIYYKFRAVCVKCERDKRGTFKGSPDFGEELKQFIEFLEQGEWKYKEGGWVCCYCLHPEYKSQRRQDGDLLDDGRSFLDEN